MVARPDHAHALHLATSTRHAALLDLGWAWAFLTSITVEGLTVSADASRSLTRSRSLDWRFDSPRVAYSAGQGSHIVFNVTKISNVQIVVIFIFAHSRHIRNIRKFAPYENFPLYDTIIHASYTTRSGVPNLTRKATGKTENLKLQILTIMYII